MITEDYVSFEVARLLKDKGFDQNCATYYLDGQVWRHYHGEVIPKDKQIYAAPTQAIAMKWLREVHNLHIYIFVGKDSSCDADGNPIDMWHFWSYNITNLCGDMVYDAYDELDCVEYQSYEEACEAAIKYCLENLI